MRTKLKILLTTSTVALVCGGAAAAALPLGATDYPWVQPPAWVGTGVVGEPLAATASPPGVELPASIPLVTPTPGIHTGYPWVQPPAWVGTGVVGEPLAATSYQWVQPPASIPTG